MLAANAAFLRSAHAYPLTTYPGHSHPYILETLLTKKLAPRAEEWIGNFTGEEESDQNGAPTASRSNDDITELWNWAGPAESQVLRQMLEDGAFEDDFTTAEREAGIETVVTGLRRNLDGGASDDDENVDTDMTEAQEPNAVDTMAPPSGVDVSRPALPLDNVLRFLSTGDVHSHLPPQRR